MGCRNKPLPFGSRPRGRETSKFKCYLIRERIDPLDFYVHELDEILTRKPSWTDAGICPFHVGDTPGSFYVNLNTGAFKCLSCETEGCNIVDFTMALHSLSFSEALEKLEQQWCYHILLNRPGPWDRGGCHHAKN